MKKNILAILLLLIGTTAIWTVVCYHWFGNKPAKVVRVEVQKQDSIIDYKAGEYDRMLQEQIELYGQLRTYEDAQSKAKTTYKRTRNTIIIRDTITRVDVANLVNTCDSVLLADSLVIDNLEKQISLDAEIINNRNETIEVYQQQTDLLKEELNKSVLKKEKFEAQKKRRGRALVGTTGVAIASILLLIL
jgi:hypothetical protein